MNRLEVQKVLATVSMIYPNFVIEEAKRTVTVDTWFRFLQNYDYTDVSAAIGEYVETSNSSFAPNLSQIIGIVKKHQDIPVRLSFLEPAEAWALVRKALENSAYDSEAQFATLPQMVRRAVGTSKQLFTWATDPNYNEGVISSNFKSNYKEVCDRELAYNDLNTRQRQGVDEIRQRLIDGERLCDIEVKNTAENMPSIGENAF